MAKQASELRLLLVDDDLSVRKLIKAVCFGMGIRQIIEAPDGRQAIQVLKTPPASLRPGESLSKRKFDLIISDWMMPEMNGLELLKHVRQESKVKNIPFILLTAEREQENVSDAIKAGVTDYIIKPFTTEDLQNKLSKLLLQ